MLAQPPLWVILIAFVAALGPLIVIHELGHYLVARWLGVGAETFSIGFGPEIGGWTDKRGTRWKLCAVPLGGYVRFAGDADAASRPTTPPADAADDPRSFQLRPVWQRFLIVLAGPVANFLLAIAIIAGFIAAYGVATTPNVVVGTLPGSAAAKAGLQPGDRIVEMADRSTPNFEAIAHLASLYPDEEISIRVVRNGQSLSLKAHLGVAEARDRFGDAYRIGLLGIPNPGTRFQPVPLQRVLPLAIDKTGFLTRSMAEGVWQIVSGRRSVKEIGGPLKMAQLAGQQATLGWQDFASLLALFSINLGFINLLPVPMLDGGHLFFYGIEAVRRRPLSERAQDWAFRGGLALLLALLLFTTFNDLGSFGLWDRLERLIG
jgi:regulator of sigma E protease